jgi:tRNA threonylcarbamoyladenosine biosynthesis protein TsaB
MNILAIDTAMNTLSVALGTDTGRWYFEADAGHRHSEILLAIVDTLLGKAGLVPTDIGLAACMKGPGSFTGLRIGYSTAKALSLSLGIPIAAAPTLDCMVHYVPWPGLVMPVIDAKKRSFFCAIYQGGKRVCLDMDAEPQQIASTVAAIIKVILQGQPLSDQIVLTGGRADEASVQVQVMGYANKGELYASCPILLTGTDAALLKSELEKYSPIRFCLDERKRGYARELLELAPNWIEADIFSGPEYIRKSDAEEQAVK